MVWGARLTLCGMALLFGYSAGEAQQARSVDDALLVESMAPDLESVRLGRVENLSEEARRRVEGLDVRFRFEQDLNSDGQQELILLGTHVQGGSQRSFALVARAGSAGEWVRARLFTFDEEFVAGRQIGERLAVFFCTGCDYGGWIEWTGSDYQYVRFASAGVP